MQLKDSWVFTLGLVRRSAMVLLLAFVVWVSYRLHLPAEEEHLRGIFGDAYEAYRQRTARYFGVPRSRTSGHPRSAALE